MFVDAPGTGFSRIAGKDKEKAFYGVDADAYAFAELITAFLSKYNQAITASVRDEGHHLGGEAVRFGPVTGLAVPRRLPLALAAAMPERMRSRVNSRSKRGNAGQHGRDHPAVRCREVESHAVAGPA